MPNEDATRRSALDPDSTETSDDYICTHVVFWNATGELGKFQVTQEVFMTSGGIVFARSASSPPLASPHATAVTVSPPPLYWKQVI